jgi:hypothetical protein
MDLLLQINTFVTLAITGMWIVFLVLNNDSIEDRAVAWLLFLCVMPVVNAFFLAGTLALLGWGIWHEASHKLRLWHLRRKQRKAA